MVVHIPIQPQRINGMKPLKLKYHHWKLLWFVAITIYHDSYPRMHDNDNDHEDDMNNSLYLLMYRYYLMITNLKNLICIAKQLHGFVHFSHSLHHVDHHANAHLLIWWDGVANRWALVAQQRNAIMICNPSTHAIYYCCYACVDPL